MEERDCIKCVHAKITGKYYPATRLDPEEYPECECGCDDKRIEVYFSHIEHIEDKHLEEGSHVDIFGDTEELAKYCPFFKEVVEDCGYDPNAVYS